MIANALKISPANGKKAGNARFTYPELEPNCALFRRPDGAIHLPSGISGRMLCFKPLAKREFEATEPLSEPGLFRKIDERWLAKFELYRASPTSEKALDWIWSELSSMSRADRKFSLISWFPADIHPIWRLAHKGITRKWHAKLLQSMASPASEESIRFRRLQERLFAEGRLNAGQIQEFEKAFGKFKPAPPPKAAGIPQKGPSRFIESLANYLNELKKLAPGEKLGKNPENKCGARAYAWIVLIRRREKEGALPAEWRKALDENGVDYMPSSLARHAKEFLALLAGGGRQPVRIDYAGAPIDEKRILARNHQIRLKYLRRKLAPDDEAIAVKAGIITERDIIGRKAMFGT